MRCVKISAKLVILTALELEGRALEPVIASVADVQLHVIGIRAKRLPQIDLDSRVIVTGLAGALDPDLVVGDLVLDTPFSDLPADLRWRIGPIHTSMRLLSTPAEKASLFRETGALAVEMEQAVVRKALPDCVQVIGLRAISDPASMMIDPAVLRLVDDAGRPRPLAIAGALLRRPTLIAHLRQLQANSRLALSRLALGIAALIERLARDDTGG